MVLRLSGRNSAERRLRTRSPGQAAARARPSLPAWSANPLAAPPDVRTVLVDEVQRVPTLLDGIQAVADAHPRRFRFLLSASSARKLKKTGIWLK